MGTSPYARVARKERVALQRPSKTIATTPRTAEKSATCEQHVFTTWQLASNVAGVRWDQMHDDNQLTVKQTATGYWVVQSGSEQISGAVTRQAAEAERDLMRRLRRRTADMRSASPRRPRAVQRLPR